MNRSGALVIFVLVMVALVLLAALLMGGVP